MRGARSGTALGALVAVLVVVAGSAVAGEDLSIEIGANGGVQTDDPGGWVLAEDHEPPERYAWQLALEDSYQLVNVTIDEGFAVDRGRQLVPLNDSSHFVEVDDPAAVDRAAEVYNLTGEEDGWRYQLGLPGPAQTNLTLERDLQPPAIEIVSIGNVTDIGFDLTTDTDEPAQAELYVREDGETIQSYPTPRPGPWQQFPVQGLEENTTYEAYVEARDWSGNANETETVEVTTERSEEPPTPAVEPVRPQPNATVGPEGVVVEASYEEHGWPVVEEDVRLFFDKQRVDPSEVEVGDGSITYHADGPLDERPYFVSVEVPNTADGVGKAQWSFTVEETADARQAPAAGPVGAVASVLAGLALAGRRW